LLVSRTLCSSYRAQVQHQCRDTDGCPHWANVVPPSHGIHRFLGFLTEVTLLMERGGLAAPSGHTSHSVLTEPPQCVAVALDRGWLRPVARAPVRCARQQRCIARDFRHTHCCHTLGECPTVQQALRAIGAPGAHPHLPGAGVWHFVSKKFGWGGWAAFPTGPWYRLSSASQRHVDVLWVTQPASPLPLPRCFAHWELLQVASCWASFKWSRCRAFQFVNWLVSFQQVLATTMLVR